VLRVASVALVKSTIVAEAITFFSTTEKVSPEALYAIISFTSQTSLGGTTSPSILVSVVVGQFLAKVAVRGLHMMFHL
jgi:hypothetical protein